jgi:hypothetical protein
MPCPYATLLGTPREGVHAARFMGDALNDTLITIAAAIMTSYIFNISLVYSLITWFVGGEILHYAFGVQTEVLTRLGIRVNCKN